MVKRAEDQEVKRDHHAKGGTPIGAYDPDGVAVDTPKNSPKNLIPKATQKHTYVAYYRVSTRQQEHSGLGLDAQRQTVRQYIKHNGNRIVAEFTEIESGRKKDRPQLNTAIQLAKDRDATLVVARLDRLSRDVHFTTTLMKSKVKFVACDIPEATNLTIHIFAAIAQEYAEYVSKRTKEGLQAKKEREPDWKPGRNNFTEEGRIKAHAAIRDNANNHPANRHAWHFIDPRRSNGMSYGQIAKELNAEGYRTRHGNKFHAAQVRDIWMRFTDQTKHTRS